MTPEARGSSTCSNSLELRAGILLLAMGSAYPPNQGIPTLGTGHPLPESLVGTAVDTGKD